MLQYNGNQFACLQAFMMYGTWGFATPPAIPQTIIKIQDDTINLANSYAYFWNSLPIPLLVSITIAIHLFWNISNRRMMIFRYFERGVMKVKSRDHDHMTQRRFRNIVNRGNCSFANITHRKKNPSKNKTNYCEQDSKEAKTCILVHYPMFRLICSWIFVGKGLYSQWKKFPRTMKLQFAKNKYFYENNKKGHMQC